MSRAALEKFPKVNLLFGKSPIHRLDRLTDYLGGDVEIPTLGGNAKMKIPQETQTGATFRLKGKGVKPVRENYTGDLLCHVVVETPVKLTERQKEILRELEDLNQADSGKHSPRSKSWVDKVRDFFD